MPFGVTERFTSNVPPFGPTPLVLPLHPAPLVQLPLCVAVPPRGPLELPFQLTLLLVRLMELDFDHVLPELEVKVALCVQVPPEQLRLKFFVMPRPPGVLNDRVPDAMPGERLIDALCDQPGL